MSKYAKAIVAVAGVVASVATVVSGSDLTSTQGIITCVISVLVALGVYQVKNAA
jgi:hypothetical protein